MDLTLSLCFTIRYSAVLMETPYGLFLNIRKGVLYIE